METQEPADGRASWLRVPAARLAAVLAAVSLAGCTLATIVRHGSSGVDDYRIFAQRPLHASPRPFRFADRTAEARVPRQLAFRGQTVLLERMLEDTKTLGFIVIKDDAVLMERYLNGHSRETPTLAFSMSKSVTSILVGCALTDGLFRSTDQKITDFIPELAPRGFGAVTLEHLLQMTSGSDYRDSDFPLARHPRMYYGHDMTRILLRDLRLETEPGSKFIYKSADNQLLGLALSRALHPRTVTDYAQERLWTPLGMEYDGAWSLDREGGLEKTYCCLSGRAIDFAKIGRLYLRGGDWDGASIVPRSWVERSIAVDTSGGSPWFYERQWWLGSRDRGDFLAWGHLGQILYVYPRRGVVIVRVGRASPGVTREDWVEILAELAERV